MTCEGCAGAVTRILKKIDGVSNIVTDIPGKTVTVDHAETVEVDTMLAALKKWGQPSGKVVELKA
jgi:copper chaperone